MRIAFVSKELYPLGGGGIGQFVNAVAGVLGQTSEVLILTSSMNEPEYRRLRLEGDERLPDPDVRVEFVPEPLHEETAGYFSDTHCYSARVYQRLRELYGARGPDIVEFPDYLAEGYVTVQAAQAFDPFLAEALLCVRLHSSKEMCEVLNGCLPDDPASRVTHAMERYVLANADRVIWQGGDILGTYRRFYGANAIAADVRIRYPVQLGRSPTGAAMLSGADLDYGVSDRLRLLYFGRLERRKGVHRLMSAVTALPGEDWTLAIVGDDTPTAPLGTWMRDCLELERADDPRIEFHGGLPREALWPLIRASDVIVLPSLWECWPHTALEAMLLNRPVLATPTGGFVELVQPGRSGWLTRDVSVDALTEALHTLLTARHEIEELIRTEAPRAHATDLTRADDTRLAYGALATVTPPRATVNASAARSPTQSSSKDARSERTETRHKPEHPLVSAVVVYDATNRFIREPVASLVGQTYPKLEIIVVNDGLFSAGDVILDELAAQYRVVVVSQPSSGPGAARNFGVSQSRGRHIVQVDWNAVAEPEFVARCVAVLEARPRVPYVTAWCTSIDPSAETPRNADTSGYYPLGNHAEVNASPTVAGGATAVIRRSFFDLGFRYSEELAGFEHWHLYRSLRGAGHIGVVIPEPLIRHHAYPKSAVHEVSLLNLPRIEFEIAASLREESITWTS